MLKIDQCQVVAHRTVEKNGYVALQLGSGSRKVNNVSKAERGNFAIAKVEPKRKLAEFRVSDDALIPVGAEITADHFVVGQFVDVTGTSVGKGFAGGMKLKKERFNLRFQRATGQLENTARVRQVRRDIARVQTIARQKRASADKAK